MQNPPGQLEQLVSELEARFRAGRIRWPPGPPSQVGRWADGVSKDVGMGSRYKLSPALWYEVEGWGGFRGLLTAVGGWVFPPGTRRAWPPAAVGHGPAPPPAPAPHVAYSHPAYAPALVPASATRGAGPSC